MRAIPSPHVLPVLLLLALAACGTPSDDTGPKAGDTASVDSGTADTGDSDTTVETGETGDTAPGNGLPSAPTLHFEPTVPAPGVGFAAVMDTPSIDPDGDEVTYTWAWTVDGVDAGISDGNVPADRSTLGSRWELTVTPSDGKDPGEPAVLVATVGNEPPSLLVMHLSPEEPVEGDDLEIVIDTVPVDADGDEVIYTVNWTNNGEDEYWFKDEWDVAGKYVENHDVWTVVVTWSDGYHTPESVSATVTAEYTCTNLPTEALSDTNLTDARAYHGIAFVDSDETLVGWDGSSLMKSTHGGSRSLFVPGINSAEQMDRLPNGDIVYADNGNGALVRVESSGATSNITTGLGSIYGVTVGPDGMVYVTYNSITRVDPDTGEKTTIYDPGFSSSIGTAHAVNFSLDSTKMYIATIGAGKIFQMDLDANLDPTSDPYLFYSGLGSWMDGIELDECGNLYIPDYSDSTLWRVSADGSTADMMVKPSSTNYGHGVVWGTGVGDWAADTLYLPQPYNGYTVREVRIGFESGDTVRTWNGAPVVY
jgi:streptogramin lyase